MIDILPNANWLEPRYFVTVSSTVINAPPKVYMFCDREDALSFAFKTKQTKLHVNVTFKRQLHVVF